MAENFDLVAQVAPSRSTILLQGESGTAGLIAKAIHLHRRGAIDRSYRQQGSMPADLLESNLFGHVKGAFTRAIASKKGLFEVADQGTLFWTKSDYDLDTQSKNPAACQDRKFMHLAAFRRCRWTCASLQPPTSIFGRWSAKPIPRRFVLPPNVITIDLPHCAIVERRSAAGGPLPQEIFEGTSARDAASRPKAYGRW